MKKDQENFINHLKSVITQIELELAPNDITTISVKNLTKIKNVINGLVDEVEMLREVKNDLKQQLQVLTGKLMEKDLEMKRTYTNLDKRLDIKG